MNDFVYTFGYGDGVKNIIKVEIAILKSLPMFQIVGLGAKTIQESKERILSVMNLLNIKKIMGKIIINLSPANTTKTGTHYDLPICLLILLQSDIKSCINLADYLIIGELSLDGDLLSVKKAFIAGIIAKAHNKKIICAYDDYETLKLIMPSENIFSFLNIKDVINYLKTGIYDNIIKINNEVIGLSLIDTIDTYCSDLEILFLKMIAAGKHNGIMIGAPGSGKTTMANILKYMLPEIKQNDALEVMEIYDYANVDRLNIYQAPFRSPHFTSSKVSLIGGGLSQSPGEISLAHHGVLFLDEICEYDAEFLNCLRTPLEENLVHISRVNYKVTYKANIMLLAAANPCSCGYSLEKNCKCKNKDKYLNRIPGPIMDRIDATLYLYSRDIDLETKPLNLKEIRDEIQKIRNIQIKRYGDVNAKVDLNILTASISQDILKYAINISNKHKASIRSYGKLLRLARTIADIYGYENITKDHINIAKMFSANLMNSV